MPKISWSMTPSTRLRIPHPITGRGSTRWLVAAVALLAVSGITWLLEFWIQQGIAGVLPDSRTCSGSLYGYNLAEESRRRGLDREIQPLIANPALERNITW